MCEGRLFVSLCSTQVKPLFGSRARVRLTTVIQCFQVLGMRCNYLHCGASLVLCYVLAGTWGS